MIDIEYSVGWGYDAVGMRLKTSLQMAFPGTKINCHQSKKLTKKIIVSMIMDGHQQIIWA